jgi:hypothetical protein
LSLLYKDLLTYSRPQYQHPHFPVKTPGPKSNQQNPTATLVKTSLIYITMAFQKLNTQRFMLPHLSSFLLPPSLLFLIGAFIKFGLFLPSFPFFFM